VKAINNLLNAIIQFLLARKMRDDRLMRLLVEIDERNPPGIAGGLYLMAASQLQAALLIPCVRRSLVIEASRRMHRPSGQLPCGSPR
jgi:hypothetical protein